MHMGLFGIHSTEAMGGTIGVLGAIQAQIASAAAANGATAAAVIPAGNEGASARALLNQNANAAMFAKDFSLGLKEMMELLPTLTAATVTTEATAIAGAQSI